MQIVTMAQSNQARPAWIGFCCPKQPNDWCQLGQNQMHAWGPLYLKMYFKCMRTGLRLSYWLMSNVVHLWSRQLCIPIL